jgi:hypothetical protein
VIITAVISGVIVTGLAWAGRHDYRQRRRAGRLSVSENFKRQREIDAQKLRDITPGGEPGGL